jgi:hypothetical protein
LRLTDAGALFSRLYWGRDAALWPGRCAGRWRLAQLGKRVGNLDYAGVSKAIAPFE